MSEGLIWILYDSRIMIDCFKNTKSLGKHARFIQSGCPYLLEWIGDMKDGDLFMWDASRWIIECHLLK